jgi:hypothetical protein
MFFPQSKDTTFQTHTKQLAKSISICYVTLHVADIERYEISLQQFNVLKNMKYRYHSVNLLSPSAIKCRVRRDAPSEDWCLITCWLVWPTAYEYLRDE